MDTNTVHQFLGSGIDIVAILGLLAHVRAIIPMPDWLGLVIDILVGNYGHAKNDKN